MLRPDGAYLFVGCELASLGLREGSVERGVFLGGQLDRRLILSGKLEKRARERVLHVGAQGAGGFNCLFEKLCQG